MNFLYELLLKIVSIARGYILCPAGSVQNNTYQNRKAPFEESGAESNSEADGQRGKARRYRFIRIAFIIFIILLCLILAISSPLRCFAMSYANEQLYELLISSLASYAITGAAAVLAAETILPICIGICASLTVATIAQAINTAVECGAWQEYVINVQNNYEYRKEHGSSILNMKAFAFLYAYDWVKQHILGISPEEENTGSTAPTFEGMKNLGESVWASNTKGTYEKTFELDKATFTDGFRLNWKNGANRLTHYAKLSSGNVTLNFEAPQLTDIKIKSDSTYDYPLVDISLNHYSPIFTKTSCKLATYFIQMVDEEKQDIRKFNGVQDAVIKSCQYVNPSNKTITVSLSNYDASTKKFYIPYSLKADCAGLILKDGTTVTEFDSDLDFAYQFLYKASYYGEVTVKNGKFKWTDPLTATAGPIAIPLENQKYYDKDRDTIATTAGSVKAKVKDGSITSDTDGKVTVKVNSPAIPKEGTPATVTPDTKINEPVKVTDISTTLEGVQTMDPGDAITIGSNNIELGAQPMGDKLPFSGLKSISELSDFFLVKSLNDDMPTAPLIPINFTVPVINESIKFDINFAVLDPYISLIRLGFAVEFCISIYLSFKKWLMNKEV